MNTTERTDKRVRQTKWRGHKMPVQTRRCLGIKPNGEDCKTVFEHAVYRLCQSCRNGNEGMSDEYGVCL